MKAKWSQNIIFQTETLNLKKHCMTMLTVQANVVIGNNSRQTSFSLYDNSHWTKRSSHILFLANTHTH